MAKRTKTGTNVEQVKAQNAAAAAGNSDIEFASETDVSQVRAQNAKSMRKKK